MKELCGWWVQVILLTVVCVGGCVVDGVAEHGAGVKTKLREDPGELGVLSVAHASGSLIGGGRYLRR